MSKLSFNKKARCQGCKALEPVKGNGTILPAFKCLLDCAITFDVEGGYAMRPTPADKCYKPKSTSELNEAKKILKAKAEKAETNVA